MSQPDDDTPPNNAHQPVESLCGIEQDVLGDEGQAMIVRGDLDEIRNAVVRIRTEDELQWGIWLVQLRGHDWTILQSEGPLDEGVISIAGTERISEELATDAMFCVTEDTSGVIVGCIFRSGESLLMIDNLSGIRVQHPDYEMLPRESDNDEEEYEFDTMRHLDHYLREQGTYLPAIWPKVPPDHGVPVTAAGLSDADFKRVEYLASYE